MTDQVSVDPAGPDEQRAAEMFEGAESIEEAIGLAIGAASMCWENPAGAGVFDSSRAALLVKQLYEHVQLRWSLADARPVSPSPATTEPEKLRRQVEAHRAVARDWYLRYEEAQQRFLDLAGSLGADSATTEAEPDEAADELLVKTVIAASGGQAWLDGPTEQALTARIVINALRASLDARRRQARPSAVPAAAPVPAEDVRTEWAAWWGCDDPNDAPVRYEPSDDQTGLAVCNGEATARWFARHERPDARVARRSVPAPGSWVAVDPAKSDA